jgi:hypothetical protein
MASPTPKETTLTKADKQNLLQNLDNLIAIGKESALAGLELVAGFNPVIASAIKTASSPRVTQLLTTLKDQGVNQAADYAAGLVGNIQDKRNMMQGQLTNQLKNVVGTAADAANSAVLSSAPSTIQNAAKARLMNKATAAFDSKMATANRAAANMAGNATAAFKNKVAVPPPGGGGGRQRIRKHRTKKRRTKKRRTKKRRTRNTRK